MSVEFICEDCDSHVYDVSADTVPDPPRCAVCRWLVEHVPDPVERDAIRKGLYPDEDETR